MISLGPPNFKAFGTIVLPWVITLDALELFRVPDPKSEFVLASHREDVDASSYEIDMKVGLVAGGYQWRIKSTGPALERAAHLASAGADLQTGDILGTGTLSGAKEKLWVFGGEPPRLVRSPSR